MPALAHRGLCSSEEEQTPVIYEYTPWCASRQSAYGVRMSACKCAALLIVAYLLASAAHAQPYPSRPITIVIGYTPGAVSDLAARTIADGLHQAWGQPA